LLYPALRLSPSLENGLGQIRDLSDLTVLDFKPAFHPDEKMRTGDFVN